MFNFNIYKFFFIFYNKINICMYTFIKIYFFSYLNNLTSNFRNCIIAIIIAYFPFFLFIFSSGKYIAKIYLIINIILCIKLNKYIIMRMICIYKYVYLTFLISFFYIFLNLTGNLDLINSYEFLFAVVLITNFFLWLLVSSSSVSVSYSDIESSFSQFLYVSE